MPGSGAAAVELEQVARPRCRWGRSRCRLVEQREHAVLGRPDPLAADLDDLAIADLGVDSAPADPVAGLEHDHRARRPRRARGPRSGRRTRRRRRPTSPSLRLPAVHRRSVCRSPGPARVTRLIRRRSARVIRPGRTICSDAPADAVRVRSREPARRSRRACCRSCRSCSAPGSTGGRRRPLGIVTGLALSFTFATVALVYVIDALGLPDDLVRGRRDRRPVRLRDRPARPAARRPPRGLLAGSSPAPARAAARASARGLAARRRPRARLRALRRPDPGRA